MSTDTMRRLRTLLAEDERAHKTVISVPARTISGYAATFHQEPDRVGDIIAPGAFAKSLASKSLDDIGVYVAHQTDKLAIGRLLDAHEDGYGLHTTAKIHNTADGDDLLQTAKELQDSGSNLGMSIGYSVVRSDRKSPPGGKPHRVLRAVDLHEVSYAHKGLIANPRALVTSVKTALRTREQLGAFVAELDSFLMKAQFEDFQAEQQRKETLLFKLKDLVDHPVRIPLTRDEVVADLDALSRQLDSWEAADHKKVYKEIDAAESRRLWDWGFRSRWDRIHAGGMDRCQCEQHRVYRAMR